MPAKKPRTTEEPQTLQEALIHFEDADLALEFFVQIRWPEGVTCPYCGGKEHSFISTRQVWACKKGCKKRFSVKIGTLMEDSPISLSKWIGAIWMITNAKNGVSSWKVHRALGVTQKTAWFLLHRIRLALQQGSFDKMSGQIEVDETFIGQKARTMHASERKVKVHGRGSVGKTVVLGLLDRSHDDKPSRVKARVVPDNKKRTVQPHIRALVEEGSEVHTDALKSYDGLDEYIHQVIDHAEKYVEGHVHTNGMENFWSLLRRTISGTYVSVEPFHLFRYLDEQSFRFNERKDNDAGRFKKAAQGLIGKRLTYDQLTGEAVHDTESQATP